MMLTSNLELDIRKKSVTVFLYPPISYQSENQIFISNSKVNTNFLSSENQIFISNSKVF